MNTSVTRNTAFGIMALLSLVALSGCSQKPSSEEIAAQVKAAMAEEKAREQATAPVAAAPATTASPKPAAKPKPAASAKPAQVEFAAPVQKIVCANCGVVISVKEVELAGKGSGLGVIAGGVAGGVLGHQVGQGTGKDLATIAGAVGGAFAGNAIEKNIKKTKVYDVAVKMENGEERVLRHEAIPGVVAGDQVKVENELVVKQ